MKTNYPRQYEVLYKKAVADVHIAKLAIESSDSDTVYGWEHKAGINGGINDLESFVAQNAGLRSNHIA